MDFWVVNCTNECIYLYLYLLHIDIDSYLFMLTSKIRIEIRSKIRSISVPLKVAWLVAHGLAQEFAKNLLGFSHTAVKYMWNIARLYWETQIITLSAEKHPRTHKQWGEQATKAIRFHSSEPGTWPDLFPNFNCQVSMSVSSVKTLCLAYCAFWILFCSLGLKSSIVLIWVSAVTSCSKYKHPESELKFSIWLN